MSDPLERELKVAAAKSLQGWEFSPAMQQKVLERVRADEAGAPLPPPSRRRIPGSWVKTLGWTAAAAAVLMIMVRMPMGFSGTAKPSAPGARDAAPQMASAPAPGQRAESATPQPTAAPAPTAPPIAATKSAASGSAPTVVLALPPADTARTRDRSPGMATLTPEPQRLALETSGQGGYLFELAPPVMRAWSGSGEPLWERRLADLSADSLLAVDSNGTIAVSAGSTVQVLNRAGTPLHAYQPGVRPAALVWSPRGQALAIIGDDAVEIYREGTLLLRIASGMSPEVAFTMDERVAVVSGPANRRTLSVYTLAGRQQQGFGPVPGEGRGIALIDGDRLLVAGGMGFDLNLKPQWQTSYRSERVYAGGGGLVYIRDAERLAAVDAVSGRLLWEAREQGAGLGLNQVEANPAGIVLVTAATDDGAGVWVLHSSGQVLLAERLEEMPLDAVLLTDRVMLLTARGLKQLPLPR